MKLAQHSSVPPMAILSVRNADVVDACRSAALGFVAGARDWDKREIAEWLTSQYRPLVIGMTQSAYKLTPAYGTLKAVGSRRVEDEDLRDVVCSAQSEVLDMLRTIVERPSLATGRFLIASGLVTRCMDDRGMVGWVPVARARMRLAERVMSLFAADFLTRPWDYEEDFVVCEASGTAHFGALPCCERRSGENLIVTESSFARAS